MPVTLPLEVYEALERGLGKDDAKTIVKSIETVISDVTDYKWKVTKDELLDAIRKEFVTRDLFEERINALRFELLGKTEKDKTELLGKIEKDKAELLGKIEKDKTELLGKIEALYEKTEKDKAELFRKIEKDKTELLGKIENVKVSLDRKFTLMFAILFFTIVFLNQNALEFLAKIFGLIK
jgi:hypothetical protein